ncbi:MAG: sugar ABC transporter permease [Spirochaetes bacterium]|nr:sugar ABC transporter permease [Spirochaetota bacterium]
MKSLAVSEQSEKRILLIPAIVVLALFTTLPYLMTFVLGLFRYDAGNPFNNKFIGLKNFLDAVQDDRFWNSLKVTAIFVGTAVPIEFLLGLGIALLLNSLPRGRGFFQSILLIPMVMPPIVVGLNWKLLYDPNYGIINYLFSVLGLPPQIWLSDPRWAILALAAVDIWQYTPFIALLSLAILVTLPKEPYEAASLEGASFFIVFRKITLPMIKSGLTIIVMLRIIEAFKDFAKIYTLTSGGPGISTETLNYYVYLNGFEFYKLGYSSALSIVLFVLVIGFSYLLIRKANLLNAQEASNE